MSQNSFSDLPGKNIQKETIEIKATSGIINLKYEVLPIYSKGVKYLSSKLFPLSSMGNPLTTLFFSLMNLPS